MEGSSYFELDAYQLLNEDEHLQMRVGNFLERTNKDGVLPLKDTFENRHA